MEWKYNMKTLKTYASFTPSHFDMGKNAVKKPTRVFARNRRTTTTITETELKLSHCTVSNKLNGKELSNDGRTVISFHSVLDEVYSSFAL